MRLPEKFGTCGGCILMAALALVASLGMLAIVIPAGDGAGLALAGLLVAASSLILSLHVLGWVRRHESSRPH